MNNRVLVGGTQSANDTVYLHTDHLGSVEATTNALGQFVNRMSFGAWGERQKADWKPGSPTETFLTTNGFTGHDQLDSHNLVHMGGRVYDPNLGRFLSADLYIQSPYDTQSFNRYSYVFNNPLSYVDPSGYSRSRSFHYSHQDFAYQMQMAVEETRTIGNRDAYWDQRITDAIKSSNQQSMMIYMALYGPTGTITAIHGTAFFGVTNMTFGVGRGDSAQQEADEKAAEELLGSATILAVKLASPGTKAKAVKAAAAGDALKTAKTTPLRNGHLAGKTHPQTGVPFDKKGYPDFSKHKIAEVKINQTGSRAGDNRAANKAAGFESTPKGHTWHHHQDGTTMQLVPRAIHDKTGHTGGYSGG